MNAEVLGPTKTRGYRWYVFAVVAALGLGLVVAMDKLLPRPFEWTEENMGHYYGYLTVLALSDEEAEWWLRESQRIPLDDVDTPIALIQEAIVIGEGVDDAVLAQLHSELPYRFRHELLRSLRLKLAYLEAWSAPTEEKELQQEQSRLIDSFFSWGVTHGTRLKKPPNARKIDRNSEAWHEFIRGIKPRSVPTMPINDAFTPD